ncbi:MAG: polysaccharide pyruvyl transferase family protein [Cyanobacteria bacterium P01_F01_bin.86]
MKVYYYQRRDRVANFGDELNTWLWQKLLPDVLAQADDSVLVGLGTLLNHLLPKRLGKTGAVFIFSTGAGYEKPLTALAEHWQLYCVRGPLTAQHLNLPAELAITDGGILLRRLVPPSQTTTNTVAFMPHVHHATFAGEVWESICEAAGFRYIDPRWSVTKVITAIQDSRLLLAEAMHGAITADALGVPWIPLTTSPRILSFKWQDWCASIHRPYQPIYLPPLTAAYPRYGRGMRSGRSTVEHWSWAIAQGNWRPLAAQQDSMAKVLEKIARQQKPILSDRTHLENLTQALEEKLVQLQKDARVISHE